MGKFHEAKPLVVESIKLEPRIFGNWNILSDIYCELNETLGAKYCLESSLDFDMFNKFTYVQLSAILRRANIAKSESEIRENSIQSLILAKFVFKLSKLMKKYNDLANDICGLTSKQMEMRHKFDINAIQDGELWFSLGNAYLTAFFRCVDSTQLTTDNIAKNKLIATFANTNNVKNNNNNNNNNNNGKSKANKINMKKNNGNSKNSQSNQTSHTKGNTGGSKSCKNNKNGKHKSQKKEKIGEQATTIAVTTSKKDVRQGESSKNKTDKNKTSKTDATEKTDKTEKTEKTDKIPTKTSDNKEIAKSSITTKSGETKSHKDSSKSGETKTVVAATGTKDTIISEKQASENVKIENNDKIDNNDSSSKNVNGMDIFDSQFVQFEESRILLETEIRNEIMSEMMDESNTLLNHKFLQRCLASYKHSTQNCSVNSHSCHPDLYYNRALVHLYLENYQCAISDLTQSIQFVFKGDTTTINHYGNNNTNPNSNTNNSNKNNSNKNSNTNRNSAKTNNNNNNNNNNSNNNNNKTQQKQKNSNNNNKQNKHNKNKKGRKNKNNNNRQNKNNGKQQNRDGKNNNNKNISNNKEGNIKKNGNEKTESKKDDSNSNNNNSQNGQNKEGLSDCKEYLNNLISKLTKMTNLCQTRGGGNDMIDNKISKRVHSWHASILQHCELAANYFTKKLGHMKFSLIKEGINGLDYENNTKNRGKCIVIKPFHWIQTNTSTMPYHFLSVDTNDNVFILSYYCKLKPRNDPLLS